ncbi:MAG: BadF/BadG/BcrA/BcrD ATPase family protein [Thermomicrobiales bacterium]
MNDRDASGAGHLFAGIDGGGTKTTVVLVDAEGVERGRATVGGSNYAAVGQETALANIRTAVREALAAARVAPDETTGPGEGVSDDAAGQAARRRFGDDRALDGPSAGDASVSGGSSPIAAAWIGLAGIDRPTDRERLMPALSTLATTVEAGNDAELILSALPDARGVAVIAGTGSIVLGRDARDEITRAGGWGHVFGDEGSGYELGRRALQMAARASDGRGPDTALLPGIMAAWSLTHPSEMIEQVYFHVDKAGIARLAGVVLASATAGDAVAVALLDESVDELALAVEAVARRLEFPGGAVPLALGGGLLCREPAFLDRFGRRLARGVTVGRRELVPDAALTAARAARSLVPVSC